jgi:hypothetical protein
MSGDVPIDGESVEVQITTAAYHEAGHIVVAAVLGLHLRPEGIMVGEDGKGFACYWKEPDLTDSSVEANVLASFAGFCAEKRLRSMRGLKPREYLGVIWSTDWKEARVLESKFSNGYLGDKSISAVNQQLEAKAEEIVVQYWPAIEEVAETLMTRNWEPKKVFASGTEWSQSANAKYLTGEELVSIFVKLGITAQVIATR